MKQQPKISILFIVSILILGCNVATPEPEIITKTIEVIIKETQIVEVTRIVEVTSTPNQTDENASYLDFSGEWKTNIATLILTQSENEVSGRLIGYGDNFIGPVTGTIMDNAVHLDVSEVLGWEDPVVLYLVDHGNTLKSPLDANNWCGVKAGALPPGCGFSGRWCLAPEDEFPAYGYADLVQDANVVSGSIYTQDGELFDEIKGEVVWGKGHGMTGKGHNQLPEFMWWMKEGEIGFDGTGAGVRSRTGDCLP